MKILCNGCSCTYGDGFLGHERLDKVWPTILGNRLDATVTNIALNGIHYWKKGKYFVDSAEAMIAADDRAMNGELDFAQSLTERVSLLAGLPEEVISTVRGEITLSPGAENLISKLIERGHGVGVVSGGFIEIIKPLIEDLKIKHYRANSLEIENGKLTGKINGPIIDRTAKANALKDFARIEAIPLDATIAVGDGANDLEMIETAGYGIAYRAKPKVQERADGVMNTRYLDSILYLI